jgi:hypothetical protein
MPVDFVREYVHVGHKHRPRCWFGSSNLEADAEVVLEEF